MEIEKIIEQQFSEIVKSGFLENTIKEQLEKTITSIIDNCMSPYSNFEKEIEKQVKESLNLGNMKLDLPSYNQLILNWITEIINNTIISIGKDQIEKNLKKFFKPIEKSEYKISEIINIFKKDLQKQEKYGEITFIRNESSMLDGYIDFYFDEEADEEKYSCSYSLRINKEGLWDATINENDVKKMKTHGLYDFDSFLFQLYAAHVKIIDDYENVEIT